jgi:hypothetical protein
VELYLLATETGDQSMHHREQLPRGSKDSGDGSDSDDGGIARRVYARPPTVSEAVNALKNLDALIRTRKPCGRYVYAKLDRITSDQITVMTTCLNHFLGRAPQGFIDASECAAQGQRRGATYARSIRRWICHFMATGDLPENNHGWWNVSTLEDEDVANEVKLHLQQVGRYARAEDIVAFLTNPDTRAQQKIVKEVSIRTAQRWLSRAGFRWRAEPKSQYFDGHERADVVAYRQTIFIPFWRELERRRIIYNEAGVPNPRHLIMLRPGEKLVLIWFHDESIFYAHDRRLVRWVHISEHAKPFQKGDGCSVMVANFFCPEWGWLCGTNG